MSKNIRFLLAGCISVVLLVGSFSGGLVVGWLIPDKSPVASAQFTQPTPVAGEQKPLATAAAPEDINALFTPFWEAWQIVHSNYVDQPVNDLELMRGAISGMLAALGDQHTSYMDPEEYKQANMPMNGEYEGIGAYVDTTGDYLTVVSPMPDSPAEKAGLKAGDKIIKVDGDDMTGIDGSLVLRRVLGPAGSKVVLTILREGTDEPFDVEIIRAKIVLESVTYEMRDDGIAYVNLSTFGDDTTADLKAALRDVMGKNPKGMILDMRNNGGGYLNTAIEVVSQFVGSGVVMYEEYGDGTRQTFEAIPGGLATKVPLVVLVNEGTASASEITAGAIQDYERGQLVGVTTYGKGSVQNWIALKDNQGAVRVTVARWLTPKERQIHEVGLVPDVEVELTPEDIEASRDPQLDKAVEILLQGQ